MLYDDFVAEILGAATRSKVEGQGCPYFARLQRHIMRLCNKKVEPLRSLKTGNACDSMEVKEASQHDFQVSHPK